MEYKKKKISEVILYILSQTGGVDQYHLFKILYFAEMKHIAKWGSRFVDDDFYALQYGPVPTKLYDEIKRLKTSYLSDSIKNADDDASNTLIANRDCDEMYISKSEREALDESIRENAHLTFQQLVVKSHGHAWMEAKDKRPNKISIISMAEEMEADESMLEYISEQIELDKALA